jgi:hypothetical protein
VNWTIAENQSSAFMTHSVNKISVITQHMGHEIPIAVGVLGFVPGLVLGLYKGWIWSIDRGRWFKMKFLHLFNKSTGFDKIEGYDDIKDIVRRALDAEDNYNLLFIGPPGSAKTLFLLGILDIGKDGVYFDGSNTTNRILDVLEEERPSEENLDSYLNTKFSNCQQFD